MIADNQPQFPWANLSQFPCQNSESRVAFEAVLAGDNHVQGMFSRKNLGGIDTIETDEPGGNGSIDTDCSINANGVVLFSTLKMTPNAYVGFLMRGGGGVPLLPLLCTDASLCTDATFDRFSGWQLNVQAKAVALAHRASDGANVVITKGSGSVTEAHARIIADNRPGSQYASFQSASIDNRNLVAFVTTRPNNSQAIVTIAEDGTVRNLLDTSGPFGGFGDIDLNSSNSLAFGGYQSNDVSGIWRMDSIDSSPTLTRITDSTITGTNYFTALSLNDSRQVAYSYSVDGFGTTVGLGNGSRIRTVFGLPPIVLAPGDQLFNRLVQSATITRDSLNNFGQLVMQISFWDGSQMIAIAEPVNPLQNILAPIGAFELSAGNGGGAGMRTPVQVPSIPLVLTFDATFLGGKGSLNVLLGDKLLKTLPAASLGMRQHIQIPIDLRQKTRAKTPAEAQELQFALSEGAGAVVHIENIALPGAGVHLDRPDLGARWHFDIKKGGSARFIDDTRFPVQIRVIEPHSKDAAEHSTVTSVAVLSTKSFDATRDIQRNTLHFGGIPVLLHASKGEAPGKAEAEEAQCAERDVDGDKHLDLVCEFGAVAAASQTERPVSPRKARLEGITPYGWMIEGRTD